MKNSRPKGDGWNVVDNDRESQYYRKNFKFDFSCIGSEEIKDVVKDYVWQNYRTGNSALNKLYINLSRFHHFNAFANIRNISSLKELTNTDIDHFVSYLHTVISDSSKKPLSYIYQKGVLDAVKSIIHWCQLHQPEMVPERAIFTGNEYTGVNRKLKIDFIPDETLAKINESLKTEENPYIKYGIVILQSTGMRIGDLLKLRIDCFKPHLISGYTMTWFDHKNRRERQPMPVRTECVQAIEKLIEVTKELREGVDESVKAMLFLHRVNRGNQHGKLRVIASNTISSWLNDFIKRNNILDANGELYNLTAHQFRRTLGTDMFSKGTNINVIQQVLGHTDPSVTKRFYADVKDKERAEIFKGIGIIGNINQLDASVFDSVIEMEWFKANKDKDACMSDGFCTKPVVDGQICDRLLKRQKCYTCRRYITTPEYLEAHKNHLASLERQIAEGAIYGEHYAEHFRSTIEVLKVIIERLEVLQNGKN
ncbi:tyrosine-type recombinase/integrase [Acetobacterium bakii]|uniref:Integrase n=1 Tax=Acetobacterium bakii TaxID=52689 RepID=A0A0L6U1P5_9FIRM|nr:site-specific integrase [Acetobacterium bakii]KNZ42426.1 integrase [Acetobacterium bakii]